MSDNAAQPPGGAAREVAPGSAKPSGPGRAANTLWHGRFEGGPADELLAFTVSLPFDQRLARSDTAMRPTIFSWYGLRRP